MSQSVRVHEYIRRNILGIVAIWLALGGIAWAAGLKPNSVKSKHIKDGQVQTNDLGDGQVVGLKLADGSVTTAKIVDNAVTGAKVDESTLAKVPSATNADDAGQLDGLDSSQLQRRVTADCTPGGAIGSVNADGTASCVAGGTGDITAVTTGPGSGLTGGATSGAADLSLADGGTLAEIADDDGSGSGLDADRLDGKDSDDFLQPGSVADGDLSGVFSDLQIKSGAVGTFEIDPTKVQKRVSGTCASQTAIVGVFEGGGVSCGATSGGSPGGSAGGDLAGSSYPAPTIAGSAVNSAKIADNSVTGADVDESTLGLPGSLIPVGQVIGTIPADGAWHFAGSVTTSLSPTRSVVTASITAPLKISVGTESFAYAICKDGPLDPAPAPIGTNQLGALTTNFAGIAASATSAGTPLGVGSTEVGFCVNKAAGLPVTGDSAVGWVLVSG